MAHKGRIWNLLAGLAAIVVLGALPTSAVAVELTDPLGSVAVGETITGTSTNFITTSAIGAFACKHIEINGIVEANESGTVAVGMDGANDTAGECHRTAGETTEALEVKPTFESLHLTTGGTSTMSLTFVVTFPALGGLKCHFKGTVAASVVPGGEASHAQGSIGGTSPAPCASGANISGTFVLEDAFGPVTID